MLSLILSFVSFTLILVTFSTIGLIAQSNQLECDKTSACSCIYNDGTNEGYSLVNITSPLSFTFENGSKIHYSPCKNMDFGLANCKSVALCLEAGAINGTKDTNGTALGRTSDAEFNATEKRKPIYIIYKTNTTTSAIKIIYDLDDTDVMTAQNDTLKLFSPNAGLTTFEVTSDGAGFFSFLSIFLLIVGFVYFVGGSLYKHCVDGAEGIEMIPHLDFWSSLPFRIREFFAYCFNGCRTTQGGLVYDSI